MKTIEVKIYYFNELTTAAQQVAIDQFRNRKYEDTSVAEWTIDDCYLFEPEHAEMTLLFGEEYKKLTKPVIANTRKNIYFDTERNRHLDADEGIEITNEKMFLTWLEIPADLQNKLFYNITNNYGRYPDTIILFEEGETDYQFTDEENKIINLIRDKNVKKLTITFNENNEPIKFETEDSGIIQGEKAKQIKQILGLKNYSAIELKTRDGNTLSYTLGKREF